MKQVVQRAVVPLGALRVVLGLTAMVRPALAASMWVGRTDDATAAVVLGRAAGARDIALGVGLLASVARHDARATRDWTTAGAFSDFADLMTTLASWPRLPRTRPILAAAAGGAALVGVAATAARAIERDARSALADISTAEPNQ